MTIKTSESIQNLAEALCAVQAVMPSATFNKVNPHFKSRYADMGSVINASRGAMVDHDLSIVQFPATAPLDYGPAVALTTRLMHHKSGEWMEDTMIIPVGKATPQAYGSALTYARRYALASILGIVADEDDDANQAQQQPKASQNGKPKKSQEVIQPSEVKLTARDDHEMHISPGKPPKSIIVADLRASLEEAQRVTLGLVADRAAMTAQYKNSSHALNAMKSFDFPGGVSVEMGQTVSSQGAVQVFDWLMARKEGEA